MENVGIATRITRYGLVGILTNAFGYGLFLTLLTTGMPPVLTTGTSYLIVVAASYWANRRWTFRSKTAHSRDAPRYVLAYGVGLLVAVGAMHGLAAIIHPAVAQLVVTVLAAMAIYTFLEMLRFGRSG